MRAPAHLHYRGVAQVQVVPPGVSGRELTVSRSQELTEGSVWRRGRQRVRIEKIVKSKGKRFGQPIVTVEFRELSHGSSVRRLQNWAFLRSSWPVVDAGGREAGGEP